MNNLSKRFVCLIKGHDWISKIDVITIAYAREPQFFQCYCKRCGGFKFGIYNDKWIDINIRNKEKYGK